MQTLPVRLDLFALVMLLGVAQGLFLGVFFLSDGSSERTRGRGLARPLRRTGGLASWCLGWFMLALAAVTAEIFLGYTNYQFRVLWLVDFSEPFNFVLGPLIFLFVFARLHHRLPRRWGWHLLPFSVWSLNAVTWYYQPIEFKYDSYVESYHPELPSIPTEFYLSEDFTGLRDYVSELTLLSCLVYAVLALIQMRQAYRRSGYAFWQPAPGGLTQLRNLTLLNLSLPFLIALVKPQYREDLGDHILASYVTGIIYVVSFMVMRGSNFFRQTLVLNEPPLEHPVAPTPELKKKYEKSALSEEVEEAVLTKLAHLLNTEKPYLDRNLSLSKLAGRLNTSPHHLSQLLNDRLGQTFFDWLATHRIAEAQRLLNDPATAHLKIDEIAERVGYNSPSAFHTAFKRLTNQTPAQFRDGQSTSSRSARTS